MKNYGFGIIGLGTIADFHVRAIQELAQGKFVAGFDVVPGKAEVFCSKYGAVGYSDLDAFLSDPAIDVVTITTPSGLHMQGAVSAAKAKKHVIVEKPLEVTIEKCDEIIEAARLNNVKLAGIFQSRFHQGAILMKQAVEENRFGTILLANAQVKWFRSQEYYDSVAWRGTWKLDGGGAVMNQSIHAIDLLQWFVGGVEEVTAHAATLAHERIEVEDTAVAMLRLKSGGFAVIESSTGIYPGFLKRIEICGTKGSAILEEEDLIHWSFAEEKEGDEAIRARIGAGPSTGGGASNPTSIGIHGHVAQFKDFIEAIENNREPLVSGQEARKSVEIIQAMYQSAQTGHSIRLPLSTTLKKG
ncbi:MULTISPECIES: Gfo/Idh/MocA family protein [unclassified Sphaerochaeta]|jgi:predicted dehydrogenase|uniref:Gfo/Idh/MocA family protein n=1 Tax=unclassified Sphaerochaeta TaxID=2637943 RepID=UPI0025FE5888|nr:Gfo/Idh/MocA family oxidoreductase [Sphaerochaeta sp. UBA5856]